MISVISRNISGNRFRLPWDELKKQKVMLNASASRKGERVVVECFEERIEILAEQKEIVNWEELKFWMKRFIPGVREDSGETGHRIHLIPKNENTLESDNADSYLSGGFSDDCESFIAKYTQQMFAKLLLRKGYLLIPAACAQRNGKAVLLLGDYWQGKTSVVMKLVTDLGYSIISDNYVILHDGTVIGGTNHISVRKENIELLLILRILKYLKKSILS